MVIWRIILIIHPGLLAGPAIPDYWSMYVRKESLITISCSTGLPFSPGNITLLPESIKLSTDASFCAPTLISTNLLLGLAICRLATGRNLLSLLDMPSRNCSVGTLESQCTDRMKKWTLNWDSSRVLWRMTLFLIGAGLLNLTCNLYSGINVVDEWLSERIMVKIQMNHYSFSSYSSLWAYWGWI